ncbi:hypothetical protein HII13_002354 [Brettanomyces bruxellensis]|nr:hypothetical protein HII13_002354 [Brettanomyces bruxellensis]
MSRGSTGNGFVPSDISELYEQYLTSGIIQETSGSPRLQNIGIERDGSRSGGSDAGGGAADGSKEDNSSSMSSYTGSEGPESGSECLSLRSNAGAGRSTDGEGSGTKQEPSWAERGAARIVTQTRDEQGKVVTRVTKKSVDDFEMTKELGEGSYSTVYLGKDRASGKVYAVKVLDKRHIIKEKKVKYVNIEKFALNRLRGSRGIIHLYYTFQDRNSLYFVLQYAPNGELLTLIKKYGSLSLDAARYYSAQLISAIDYMHTHGVIHRDLKPENVLIGSDMRILVTDFGTAKILQPVSPPGGQTPPEYPEKVRASSFVGTAEYVSPELLNDKWCGREADVWSFGCVVYQMIAGKPPFKAGNEYQTFQKVIKLQYAFSAGFPTVVRDLVRRILVTRPEARLTVHGVQQHYWYRGLAWDEASIWGRGPPRPLGPYRLTAQAMMPIVGLEGPPPGRPGVRTAGRGGDTASYAPSLGTGHATPLGVPVGVPPAATTGTPVAPPGARWSARGSAPLAAQAALVDAQRKGRSNVVVSASGGRGKAGSVNKALHPGTAYLSAFYSNTAHSNNTHSSAAHSNNTHQSTKHSNNTHPSTKHSNNTHPATAHQSTAHSSPPSPHPHNLIPGTNIPRPMLRTRIVSRAHSTPSIGGRNTNSASFGSTHSTDSIIRHRAPDETPAMTSLDLTWADFLRKDERVIKAGLVDVSRHLTARFEDMFRGKIAESPLGYSSRELDGDVLHRAENCVSMKFSDRFNKEEARYEAKKQADRGAGAKIRSLFNLKSDRTSRENTLDGSIIMKGRALVVTTLGRALFFIRHIDRQHDKYEQCAEVNLACPGMKFVEVAGAGFATSSGTVLGTFAILSSVYTLAIDAERPEISLWTRSMARSRLQQQARLVSADAADVERRKTAFKAATLAANAEKGKPPPPIDMKQEQTLRKIGVKENTIKTSETDDAPSKLSHTRHSSNTATTWKLRSTMRDNAAGNSASHNSKHTRNRSLQEREEIRILADNSPMISAAISKAVASSSTPVHQNGQGDRGSQHRRWHTAR